MTISTREATDALNDIELAERRASRLRGYERGAPHFILWGLIWMVGYGLSDLDPPKAGLAWLVLDAIGMTGSFLISRAALAGASMARKGYGRRYAALGATGFAFIWAAYFVMQPHEMAQFGAFPALVMAGIYTAVGIWRGPRWAAAGVVLGLCTVAGFAIFKDHFMLWMAAAGGSTLLLTGLWLRRP